LGVEQRKAIGLKRGPILDAQEMVLDLLEIGLQTISLRLKKINQINVLKKSPRMILKVKDLSEVKQKMQKLNNNGYPP